MSGGISAIRGFDYQATVILDLLFDHFDRRGANASVRPEGKDDLELRWTDEGVTGCRFVQVKKPIEDASTRAKPSAWSLADVVRELLPDAVAHLAGNDYEQVWVLGDEVDASARSLVEAGWRAAAEVSDRYWTAIHGLARKEAQKLLPAGSAIAAAASRWSAPQSLPRDPAEAQAALVAAASAFEQRYAPSETMFARHYTDALTRLHTLLPGVLSRIEILDANGSEIDVAERVMERLEQRYHLPRPTIERTLFRNLRGFISDIAKQPGRSFNHEELEVELRCVWPQMVPTKMPPPLDGDHVNRPGLAARITDTWSGTAVEVVGISGSGKTRLAAEIVERSQLIHPDRISLYAEVRADVSLRDCLAGAAFCLRRWGEQHPFAVAVQSGLADDAVLAALAAAFSDVSRKCLLLLDLVEGTEPPGFARDIATFVRALPANTLRLVVFGQERLFRHLSTLEQNQLGVYSFDAPGLSFEEFASLIGRRVGELDRAGLWDLYHRITAGRAAGLNVSVARALARAQTAQERTAIAARPAEEQLAYAERNRFARVTAGARAGAEKLTSFALPFRRVEAEDVFPNDNIGLAIRELLDLGLLRQHDGDAFEMHETVRAGLEGLISVQTRRDAHSCLATWYRGQGQIGAVILHLEQAGRSQEAHIRAREAFLTGENWTAIWTYIARHGLVSIDEVATVIASPGQVKGAHLLPEIFRKLGGSPEIFMGLIREQSGRMFADPEWARPILASVVEADPSRLDGLIQLILESAPDLEAAARGLTWLSIAARGRNGTIGPSTQKLLDRQPETIQRPLVALLLHGDRAARRHALQYLSTHPQLIEKGRGDGWPTFYLEVRGEEDVTDLLAAIPMVSPADMIRARGPLLGCLGGLIWRVRMVLHGPCVAALQAQTLDSDALVNAMRILVYLGEPKILGLCDALCGREDSAGTLANLVPAIAPALVDWHVYEARVLDRTVEFSVRSQALVSLAWSGRRLDPLLDRLQESESSDWPRWKPVLRIISSVTPFTAAIPVLKEALASKDDKSDVLIPAVVVRAGKASGPQATVVLLQALVHRSAHVRLSAAVTLARRRDRAALPRVVECYRQEQVSEVRAVLATAVLASGPGSTSALSAPHVGPVADLWWCILAHRTRDVSAADRLVSIAIDPDQLWTVRRAAIAAAGRLPYEIALANIELAVMSEESPFTLDRHRSLLAHDAITTIIPEAARGLERFYQGDRAGFVSCFEPYFEGFWKRTFDPIGLPAGALVADWLYDALVSLREPRTAALGRLVNFLHRPLLQAAVLRSLRLCGRPDRIDEHLATAGHAWVAIRALLERSRFRERGPELGRKLAALISGAAWADDRVVSDFLARLSESPVADPGSVSTVVPAPAPTSPLPVALPLAYQSAVRLLSGSIGAALPNGPLVLESLVVEECETLIGLADPANDPEGGEAVFSPSVAFMEQGHLVSHRTVTHRGGSRIHDRLRPAIVAANRFGLSIPWHKKQLEGPLGEAYASEFLTCLVEQGDSVRFYAALAESEGALMPMLCLKAQALSTRIEIDGRLIPALTRFLSVGGDDLFEGLCLLAKRIDAPEIQPVLAGLLYRWIQRFDVNADRPQHDEAHALWRGFARLSEHPRFDAIPEWPQQLEALLRAPMSWFHAQSIVRVLERDASSYALIEMRLFKEANWEHYNEDEVERLDRAAESLFSRVQDTSVL